MTEENQMAWSLTELYPSFESEAFVADFKLLQNLIDEFTSWSQQRLSDFEQPVDKLEEYIMKSSKLELLIGRLFAFASLSFSADSSNQVAKRYSGVIESKITKLTAAQVRLTKWVSELQNLEEIISSSSTLQDHSFHLKELAEKQKHQLSESEEVILSKMRLTSSSAWAKYKNVITADHMVDIELDGKIQAIGINKIKNMYFSTDGELRKKAHYAELVSNDRLAEGVAAALNNIKGEVLTVCELKGFQTPLEKTLLDARMDEKTLQTMLKVMKDNLPTFQQYFSKKAQLLGHKGKLPYYDVMAPVGNADMYFSYEQAKEFIVKHFSSFDTKFGELAETAFEHRWIDAEVRDGKRGGAFCHNLQSISESRILCSFEGSFKNVCTLAHELGHAYHGMLLQSESALNTDYPMPLAETASIFAENIVRNAAMEIASNEEAQIILAAELVNCSSVIVDIYARYLFETELFERRKDGDVPVTEIKEIMLWAQKEAYGEAIDQTTFDPYAWMHKPHYYYVERNYYNFPYAFGLLFSKGLYNKYLTEGATFVDKYHQLLRLTGKATIYDVAAFAGIDLHDEEFWNGSMNIVKRDIEHFCRL